MFKRARIEPPVCNFQLVKLLARVVGLRGFKRYMEHVQLEITILCHSRSESNLWHGCRVRIKLPKYSLSRVFKSRHGFTCATGVNQYGLTRFLWNLCEWSAKKQGLTS